MRKARLLEIASLPTEVAEMQDTIAVTAAMPPADVIKLVHGTEVRHVVQKDSMSFDTEMAVSRLMIENPRCFMERPIEIILGLSLEAVQLPNLSVVSSPNEKKTGVLNQFENFLAALSGTRTIREQAILIADELYTNGAKNAWLPGKKPDESPTRDGQVEFFACADGTRLIFGCVDSFGELGLARILTRIRSCYENGVAQSINHGVGGAGIGSFMVFNNCISYYAGVDLGKRTVVCVALPLGLSLRESAKLTKNIHLLSVA